MIKKICLHILLLSSSTFAVEIPTAHAKVRDFSKSIELNAQVIQLSNARQAVTSQISGHLEKYFVKAGQSVKAGAKIALIESIKLSQMTTNFISLKKQYISLEKNYKSTIKLYESGMTSVRELNNQSIKKDTMLAQINTLKSQLNILRIDTSNITKASPNFILYAHSAGRISQLLLQRHTVIRVDEAIVNIVKEQAFYIKSFVPIKYASKIKIGQKILIDYNNRNIVTHVTQILPLVDKKTQRIVLLSSVDEKTDDLFINTYVKATLFFSDTKKYVAVEKSALSFFNNEWVIFVPKEEHNESEHDEHESPYEARVVQIITQDNKYIAINGLEENEEYVSAKSYYVKSMMLKSSLGEHGH
jgi:multidrug efflux pump subunit AcrA (membrane-fusion protein)